MKKAKSLYENPMVAALSELCEALFRSAATDRRLEFGHQKVGRDRRARHDRPSGPPLPRSNRTQAPRYRSCLMGSKGWLAKIFIGCLFLSPFTARPAQSAPAPVIWAIGECIRINPQTGKAYEDNQVY